VSLPCLELFLEQPPEFQRSLVPDDGTPVVAVEAGRGESLRRLVGSRGLIRGIDRFGASAPHGELAELFGFTTDQLTESVRQHLERLGS
jgi:transketolase